jgi:hypothetical protein
MFQLFISALLNYLKSLKRPDMARICHMSTSVCNSYRLSRGRAKSGDEYRPGGRISQTPPPGLAHSDEKNRTTFSRPVGNMPTKRARTDLGQFRHLLQRQHSSMHHFLQLWTRLGNETSTDLRPFPA